MPNEEMPLINEILISDFIKKKVSDIHDYAAFNDGQSELESDIYDAADLSVKAQRDADLAILGAVEKSNGEYVSAILQDKQNMEAKLKLEIAGLKIDVEHEKSKLRAERLKEAEVLAEAKKTIKAWYEICGNKDWVFYDKTAPEMKSINKRLASLKGDGGD